MRSLSRCILLARIARYRVFHVRGPRDPKAWTAAHPNGKPPPAPSSKPSNVTSLDEWAAAAPKRKKGLRSAGKNDVEAALDEANAMRKAGDWTAARPRHLVALYVQLHAHVYGVQPTELRGKTWTAACLMASRLLEREFTGDTARFVAFIAWTWKCERKAHARGNPDRRRLGWRLQFSPALVTDYRVHLLGESKRPHVIG